MLDKKAFKVGLNLGGWISQYPAYNHDHFKTFITATDIKRIADWGMDHVRLPVDYPVLEDDSQPGTYKDSGFDYIEACLGWCQENGLRAILDLHKAPGFAFDELNNATLFTNPALQERFLALWAGITRHFAGRMEDGVAFELLNEIMLPDSSDPWNELGKKAVERILALDPERVILVGGNYFNAPDQLDNLKFPDVPNILYTFHDYFPMTVTHQKAPWVADLVEYNHTLDYPGQEAVGLEDFIRKNPKSWLRTEMGIHFDKSYLLDMLQPALDFSQWTGQPVFCGEFGVYEGAPLSARLNWTRDLVALLNEFNIGRAYWTYKALDFGLVDKDGKVIHPELVEIVSQR